MRKIFLIFLLLSGLVVQAQRQIEYLTRGVVAVQAGKDSVFVSWRLLYSDDEKVAFNVYRKAENGKTLKLNKKPLTEATSMLDIAALANGRYIYQVRPVKGGEEGTYTLDKKEAGNAWLTVPLQTPDKYSPNDISPGDLDGDGEYELVVHMTGRARDNSQGGATDEPIFQAYKLDGTLLWSINLGKNIREGAHYTQFLVYDLDGDGRAEVVMKTADGTIDGKGKVIGDATADHRNAEGHIVRGPEFLTVFDGLTGAALATTKYWPSRHPSKENPTPDEMKEVWGDGRANRSERYLACVAYLDGIHPSIVMCRGYYTRTTLAAYDWSDGKLTRRVSFGYNNPCT
jgi:rhamnogalacturonan endolyase